MSNPCCKSSLVPSVQYDNRILNSLSFLYSYIKVIHRIFICSIVHLLPVQPHTTWAIVFKSQLWHRAVGFLMGCCSYLSIYLWICLQLNNFLPVLKLYDLLYPEKEPLAVPDFNKVLCTHQMALTYIRIHLLKKSESEQLNIHRHLPHTLKVHHQPVFWLGHIIIMRANNNVNELTPNSMNVAVEWLALFVFEDSVRFCDFFLCLQIDCLSITKWAKCCLHIILHIVV